MGSTEIERIEEARHLVASNSFGAADTLLRRIIANSPDNSAALTLLGITLIRTGRDEEADERLSEALANDSNDAEALTWLAALRYRQRRYEEAIPLIDRLAQSNTINAEALNILGSCYLGLGKASEAEEAFRTAIRKDEGVAASYSNLGMALRLQNRGEEALAMFRKAAKLGPEHAGNFLQVFKQLQQLSKSEDALGALKDGLARHPGSVELSEALALMLGRMNRGMEAEPIFRKVAAVSHAAANSYAAWLQEEGRFAEAVLVLQESLRLRPAQGVAYRLLAEAKCFTLDGRPILDAMNIAAAEPKLDAVERMHLAYAFGKVHEHAKEHELAMRSYDAANSFAYHIYPNCRTFDPVRTARDPELASQLYSSEFLARVRSAGSEDARPIFVVGMIRSGTTLLDHILSSHPDVSSVGEPPFWNVEADAIHARWAGADPTESEIGDLAKKYLASVITPTTSERFTDKMPLNYRHLGLIRAVFPAARIIHIRRDPFDTCLSIYTTFFGGGPNFTYNPGNIVLFYRAYLEYMAHWRTALPANSFFEVDYEALVSEPEPQIREILTFLDVDWNHACLRHEENHSQITTPSRWQVRQPIYAASTGKRRDYGPFAPEFAELTDTGSGSGWPKDRHL